MWTAGPGSLDDERYELLAGAVTNIPTPLVYHQCVLGNLLYKVAPFVSERKLGHVYSRPTDVVLSDTTVVEPDILFVSSQRSHILTRENIQGAPDLVVEILDPPTAERDLTLKLDLDVLRGVKEYWIVDSHAKTIMVLLRGEGGFEVVGVYRERQTLRSPTLAGFSVALEEVFRGGRGGVNSLLSIDCVEPVGNDITLSWGTVKIQARLPGL